MNADLERQLAALIDKDQIHSVLMQYCRGVDRANAALLEAAFHHDAVDDHGYFKVSGSKAITEKILSWLTANSVASMHLTGNELIELDGDVAFTESYFLALLRQEREDGEFTRIRAARYVDRFERRDGRWAIAYRYVADEFDRVDAVTERIVGHEQFNLGQRSSEDIVFTLRNLTT